MSELKGKVLSEVIAEGMGKLASMPSGKATQTVEYRGLVGREL
jgi:ribosomal protein L12E/L44/L45/RPP1/RPP2